MAMPTALRKFVSVLLTSVMVAQPALVMADEYRIPLRDLRVTPPHVDPSGGPTSGVGVVDPGANPIPAKLKLTPSALEFVVGGSTLKTKSSVLVNEGIGPADLTATKIVSNNDFVLTSDCPASLAPRDYCTLKVKPTSTAQPGAAYSVTIESPSATAPVVLELTASPKPAPVLSPDLRLTDDVVNLGTLMPGESATGSTTLSNVGTADAVLNGIRSDNGFAVSSDCPATLQVGESCNISANFSSTTPKDYFVTLALTGQSGGDSTPLTFYAKVKGDIAHKPMLVFGDKNMVFDALDQGATAVKSTILSNRGTAPATLGPLLSSEDFQVSNDCPDTLDIDASCNVSVVFNARQAHTTPSYKLVARAQDDVQAELAISGTVNGIQKDRASDFVKFSAVNIVFDDMPIGQSAELPVTVTNTGTTAVGLASFKFESGGLVFKQVNDCGDALAAGATCTLSFTFRPTDPTGYSDQMSVTYADKSSSRLSMSGTGLGAVLATGAAELKVGSVVVGTPSRVLSVGIANSGNVPLTGLALVNNDSGLQFSYGDCTSTVAPSKGCTFSFTYTPQAEGPVSTTFQLITENGGSKPYTVTGLGVQVSVMPSAVQFPQTQVGTSPATATVTVNNEGQSAIPLSGISVARGSEQFGQSNNCGSSIAAGESCAIAIKYTPTKPGAHTGVIAVSSNNEMVGRADLAGTAVDYRLTASDKGITFPSTLYGQSAQPKSITITNPAPDATAITGVSIVDGASDFAQSNDCGEFLAAGASCTITVQMTPTVPTTRTGTLVVTSSRGPLTVNLGGAGLDYKLELSTKALSFADTVVGKPSEVLSVIITNPAPDPTIIKGVSILSLTTDFAQTNNCGNALAAGASCTVNVQMTPVATGNRSASLAITSSRNDASVSLAGLGAAAEPPPSDVTGYDITFLDTPVGASSAVRNIAFTNMGDGPLTVTGISLLDGEKDYATSNSCSKVLAPQESCNIAVVFSPSAVGTRTGTIALTSDGGNFVFNLKGEGIGATGAWQKTSQTDFGSVTVGSTGRAWGTFKNTGAVPLKNLSVALTGNEVAIDSQYPNACGTLEAPVTLAVNASCTVYLTYTPAAAGTSTTATLTAAGNMVGGSQPLQFTGASPTSALAFFPYSAVYPDGNFGPVLVNTPVVRSFWVKNVGNTSETLSALPSSSDSRFAVKQPANGACTVGRVLYKGDACIVDVMAMSTDVGDVTATLSVMSKSGTYGEYALAASFFQPAYTLSGSAGANTAPPSDFGSMPVNSTSTVHYFYLRDDSNKSKVAANLITLTGDPSFKVTEVRVSTATDGFSSSCSYTATGTTAKCAASSAGYVIRVGVNFKPAQKGATTAILHFEHNGSGGISDIELSGVGAFDAQGEWSSTNTTTIAPSSAGYSLGTFNKTSSNNRYIYLRNSGTQGQLGAGFRIAGDTDKFKLIGVYKINSATPEGTGTISSSGPPGQCVAATDGLSSTTCWANEMSLGSSINVAPHLRVILRFQPGGVVGTYSVILTPFTDNGTVLPDPVTITATSQ